MPLLLFALRSSTCYPGERVGPKAGLYLMKNRKISCPSRELNSDSSVVLLIAQTLYRLSYLGSRFTVEIRMLVPTEQSVLAVALKMVVVHRWE
jgi:hypothetical protein